METNKIKALSLEEFKKKLKTKCVNVNLENYTVVYFTQHTTGMVMVDISIFDGQCNLITDCCDRPKYTLEESYEMYLKLLALI